MNRDFKISLAAARVNAGLTQSEAANLAGTSKTTLCGWETGKHEPDFKAVCKLCEIYNVSIDHIFLRHDST